MPTQSTLKRPSASQGTCPSKVLKRPSAAPGSVNQSVERLKKGLAEEDPVDEKEKILRSKAKGEKWARARASGQVPDHVIWLYDVKARESGSPREYHSNIVNQLFQKGEDGLFNMNLDASMFKEAQTIYRKHYGRDEDIGMPKSLIKGLYFGNSEQARFCKERSSVERGSRESFEREGPLRETNVFSTWGFLIHL